MKIVHIFSPMDEPDEGVWALKYDSEPLNEWEKLWEEWEDPEAMYRFCINNLDDLHLKFGYPITPEIAANELMDEAEDLRKILIEYGLKRQPMTNLQHLFKPLNNHESCLRELQLSKGSAKSSIQKNPKLRVYAIRVGENTFVVTGGAIKLTDRMTDRTHTHQQWERIQRVKTWLKEEGIVYPEDLKELP